MADDRRWVWVYGRERPRRPGVSGFWFSTGKDGEMIAGWTQDVRSAKQYSSAERRLLPRDNPVSQMPPLDDPVGFWIGIITLEGNDET